MIQENTNKNLLHTSQNIHIRVLIVYGNLISLSIANISTL